MGGMGCTAFEDELKKASPFYDQTKDSVPKEQTLAVHFATLSSNFYPVPEYINSTLKTIYDIKGLGKSIFIRYKSENRKKRIDIYVERRNH